MPNPVRTAVTASAGASRPAAIRLAAHRHCRTWLRSSRARRCLPLAIAGVYLIVLITQLSAIVGSLNQNADAVAAEQLAVLITPHGGTVWLGQEAYYSSLLFGIATSWMPFYRAVWGLAPFVATGISFAAIVWSVRRVAGRWAAAMTLSLLICAGAPLLTQLGILDAHVLTWFSDSLLFAGLVWVLDSTRPVPRSRWLPLAAALGALVAVNLASDPLLYLAGIVPVLAAAVLAQRRSPSARTAEGVRYALVTAGIAFTGSILVAYLMDRQQIVASPGWTVGLAPASALAGHLDLWWRSIALLGGDSTSGTGTLTSILFDSAAALTIIAVGLIPWVARVELHSNRSAGASPTQSPAGTPARDAFVTAWCVSALLISAAFVLSTAPDGLGTIRYLVGVAIAAAALVPLLARSRAAVSLIVAATCVYCTSGLVSLATTTGLLSTAHSPSSQPYGLREVAATFLRLARREHVTHGYTGYWDAAPITWDTHFQLLAYPATTCPSGICRFMLGSESSWYRPHGYRRTFLITDTTEPYMQSAPRSLGPPAAAFHRHGYTFLVFNYDIAKRIQR